MDAGFPFELCLIPLALLATVAVLYLVARAAQTRAEKGLEQMRGEARRFDLARREIERTLQAFTDDIQEPFYSPLSELRSALDDIDRQSAPLRAKRVALKQQANNLRGSYWRAMMGAPQGWYFLHRDLGKLRSEMQQAWGLLDRAGTKEREIRRIGWSIAQQAQQVQKTGQELHQALGTLQAKGVQGDGFQNALQRDGELRRSLERIPNYLFSGSEDEILAQVDRNTIVGAHQVVAETGPPSEALLAQVQVWAKEYSQAEEAVAALERLLDGFDSTLRTLPSNIDAADAGRQLNAMRQIGENLRATLARPEVENLPQLRAEAERQAALAQEQNAALKRARREATALQAVLSELPDGFKVLSLQLATLGAKSVHPVAWRTSLDKLTKLNRRLRSLGAADKVRTPEQVLEQMKTAAELHAEQKALAEHCRALEADHAELLALLGGPEFARLETWLGDADALLGKIAGYASENWSRAEAVAGLKADVEGLKNERERLFLSQPDEALPEDEVAARLADVHRFGETYTGLQRRVEAARSRLGELQKVETQAREQLEAAGAVLGQIDYVVDSNDFLAGVAAEEVERLAGEVKRLGNELGDRRRGRIDRKAGQVETLVDRITTAANHWLDQLTREIVQLNGDLSELLKELDEIAALEEKPVVEARRLLASGVEGVGAAQGARSNFPLEALLPELKRRSDYWHACSAAANALEDFHPLIETYQETIYHRDQAHQAVNETAVLIRQKRAWPPTTVTFDAELQEFEKIDGQFSELHAGSAKAIARTAQLGNLAAKYQALTERVNQAAERAVREQTEVGEIEAQTNELAELWRNHLHQYDSMPEVSAEIKALLEDIHRTLAQIRRKHIQGGGDYNATLQAIKTLNKRVRYYQVAIDDDSALDVQGNVHRRRDSRRV